MICSEVQRTLVKSPPELWAEISDPDSLARHLGEFGEIRITRVHPEQKVEWEAENGDASGTVLIKPSGWGTKVKLTVTRELAAVTTTSAPEAGSQEEDAVAKIEPESDAEGEPQAAGPPTTSEPGAEEEEEEEEEEEFDPNGEREVFAHAQIPTEPELSAEPETPAEPETLAEPEHQPESPREPRRGFFARLFGKRRAPRANAGAGPTTVRPQFEASPGQPELDDEHAFEPESELDLGCMHETSEVGPGSQLDEPESEQEPSFEAQPAAELEPDRLDQKATDPLDGVDPEDPPETAGSTDIAADIKGAEATAEEQVTAVLTGVLDRLGAAHHRPFSRA